MPPKAPAQESYNFGDLVLGRIKGYPWWPGKVVDPQNEPNLDSAVANSKPAKKMAYLVRYYDDGDYSWLELRDLKPLPKEEIDAFVAKDSKPKSGALKRAYQTAQNPEEWEAGHAERMAKRAAGEDQEPPKKKQRKNAGDSSKAKKAPASSSKKDSTDSKAKSGKKDDKKKPSSAAESEAEKLCRAWRSKLQRAFLSGHLPKAEDGPGLDEAFTAMETWEPDQAGLEPSKLPKVLKRIPMINDAIPGDEQYKFKERSQNLLTKWAAALGLSTPVTATTVPGDKTDDVPATTDETNGGDTSMMTEADTSMAAAPVAEPDTKTNGAEPVATDEAPAEEAPASAAETAA